MKRRFLSQGSGLIFYFLAPDFTTFNFAHAVYPACKCFQLIIQELLGELCEGRVSHKMKRLSPREV